MSSGFDVFGSLNNFLNKADEDSFKYDTPTSTPNKSTVAAATGNSSEELVDLTDFELPIKVGRRGRKRDNDAIPSESFDLTNGTFEISPKKRSRRAADEFAAEVVDTIELNEEPTPEPANNEAITKPRRGRSHKNKLLAKPFTPPANKAPKAKRLTYKQALALIKAPIPSEAQRQVQLPQRSTAQTTAVARDSTEAARSSPDAARSSTAASVACDIDLTGDVVLTDKHSSAPLFQKPNSVPKKPVESSSDDDDDDFDLDSVRVKVKSTQGIKGYTYRRHQRYYDLIKIISEQENIPVSDIFLFDGDKRIHPDDTPHSSGYKISTILACRVMASKPGEYQQVNKKNQIELKFQSDKWKKPIAIKISKFDNFKTAIEIICEQLKTFKPEQFSLQFDGDDVTLTDTPVDLDFEGGEILDCRVKV